MNRQPFGQAQFKSKLPARSKIPGPTPTKPPTETTGILKGTKRSAEEHDGRNKENVQIKEPPAKVSP